jgi:hypothetical protein
VFLGELGKECRTIAYAFGFFHLAQFAALNWMEPLATESLQNARPASIDAIKEPADAQKFMGQRA